MSGDSIIDELIRKYLKINLNIVKAGNYSTLPKLVNDYLNFGTNFDYGEHLIKCVFLGKLMKIRPDLHEYAVKYFQKFPAPFIEQPDLTKKRKMSFEINDLEIVESCFELCKCNPIFYRYRWCWSDFVLKFFDHQSIEIRWLTCHCIAIITGMNELRLKQLLSTKLTNDEIIRISCRYNFENTFLIKSNNDIPTIESQNNDCIVEISGIYIPKLSGEITKKHNLVMVDSTVNNLRKIALGLSSGKAICLQGLVGSGKTTLIEYLAEITGRINEKFIKVQLGDQTDSKMLLGTYRCTDIPGEFIWQPGVITQAVIEGHWLLLEDIDSASADIASVLSSLLENSALSVPGYRDSIPIKPGFQLFFTQRLISTISGLHRKHTNSISLLEKNLLQIQIDPLSSNELKQIIIEKWPKFKRLTDRMLGVFHLFSIKDDGQISIPKTSRLISTRDFFKWCSRAAYKFDVSSQESALKVLQDGIDVFCCSYPNQQDTVDLAKEISSLLGIINQKAEYFIKSYKPTLQITKNSFQVGRASIQRKSDELVSHSKYYFTRSAAVLLERIISCVNFKEPVLLVGETGTGKTSTVQYLANVIGQKLIVINMNQQSDSADLLGGYKPVDQKIVIAPVKREFEELFSNFFVIGANRTFLGHISTCFNTQRWNDLIQLMIKTQKAAITRLMKSEQTERNKEFLKKWQEMGQKLQKLELQLKQKSALAFAFIEGSLVKAVENGYWVLLDEINLANAETLECLSGLLEGSDSSLCLLEKGDKEPVKRHKDFTLFACMNPSTDVGKKDLPAGLRNRFTEFYIDELTEKNDLLLLVENYLTSQSLPTLQLNRIVDFYLKIRKDTETILNDGLGHKPHFSLRSLCRALMIASRNPCGTFKRSLYEAFCLSFLTQLDAASYNIVEQTIGKTLIGDAKSLKSTLNQPIVSPGRDYVQFEGYWVKKGQLECVVPDDYILTPSVRKNLKDLVRIVSIGGLPVLLQGDTSVGKTSLITYLAKASGNKCVRINNHEHTDLQEYIGSYVADSEGKLVFREGLLVDAMRKGYWIILDELNLAPSDVLEALNRVLDDNRELFIAETQEIIKADPNFMLFATQNPPGSYGGRKMLSRAFRNRFVELHFNEIPPLELATILNQRCKIPPSYCKKMIDVMTELQTRRRGSAAFAGKQGFITLRDLFRWGERYRLADMTSNLYDWDQHLADEGYLVLAGKVRKDIEKEEIIEVLQKKWKREVNPQHLFTLSDKTSLVTKNILQKITENSSKFPNIVWTYNMRQLAVLISKAFQFKEPVLLVGETGGGKTTVCEIIAHLNNQQLITVNCHMHTESSDFIGGLRPVRDHHKITDNDDDEDINRLFEWVDGPLIQAMVDGNVFLADEISLADDSVLERLNSLLEPERTLLLAENSKNNDVIIANTKFYFIGTMNPGGDYGKKELSPALRNRFTEIWCESVHDRNDLILIIERNIKVGLCFGNQEDGSSGIGRAIMDFIEFFQTTEIGRKFTISIRDILTWIQFINVCSEKIDVFTAYLHGACLTFLDSLGSGVTGMENRLIIENFNKNCLNFLQKQVQVFLKYPEDFTLEFRDNLFGITPFYIELGDADRIKQDFCFKTPTIKFNTLRLLRGMQLNKAILLEGSPGVGKTSLVTALARITRNKIYRVNLSDQTDISDLFGADLPVEGGIGGQFAWRDGSLLQALKQGHWILLDELNLASQSVLEGLNACLDHRGEIFIPELGKTFKVKPGTRFFACQNPLKQGGSRRGLPKSFLNRFIQVYINSLNSNDLKIILTNLFQQIPIDIIDKMIKFNMRIMEELDNHNFGHKGSPWEFNLRDLTRWCEVMIYDYNGVGMGYRPERSVNLIYHNRMRTMNDRIVINNIFEEIFDIKVPVINPILYTNQDKVHLGDVCLTRMADSICENNRNREELLVLRSQLDVLRNLAYCVNLNWMSLLVGSSACGKSSIVKVLASLAGKTLRTLPVTSAMDTSDLLGGFEQTDYSRHLEEVLKQTERLLHDTIQIELVNKNIDDAVKLLQLLQVNFGDKEELSSTAMTTMQEETQLFLTKLNDFEKIWEQLSRSKNFKKYDELEILKRKTQQLMDTVRMEGSLNAGGKFEWVDSILIKCLHEGSWLLVDNVNLCSAAILDRLNALLEPQGTLIISERGVDNNGQMIEIKPHSDFRLFFTMDPKNGEISRAMRNRGVEIYILDENPPPDYDLKSLIISNGLKDELHVEYLLQLHNQIIDLTISDKPKINELLKTSSLISKELQSGCGPADAFIKSILEVYYKSRTNLEFNCNNFPEIIRDNIFKLFNQIIRRSYNDNVTVKVFNLQNNSELELIRQQSSLIPITDNLNVMKYLILHYYTMIRSNDRNLRQYYLEYLFSKNNLKIYVGAIQKMPSIIKKFDLKDVPLDSRWIPDTVSNPDLSRINGIILYYLFILEREIQNYNKNELSLYEYCVKIQNEGRDFEDDLLPSFMKLLEEFDHFLIEIFINISISDRDFPKILNILNWRFIQRKFRIVDVHQNYQKQRLKILNYLKLFWKWLVKSLKDIRELHELPKSFENNLQKFYVILDYNQSNLYKFGRIYQKLDDKPLPKWDDSRINQCRSEILQQFDVCSKNNNTINILKFLKKNPKTIQKIFENNMDISIENLQELTGTILDRHDLEILPLLDYFHQRKIHKSSISLDEEFISSTVPISLSKILHLYQKNNDKSLKHEFYHQYFYYLTNSAGVQSRQYYDDDSIEMTGYNPNLSYHLTKILLGNRKNIVNYGNYYKLELQHKRINLILWRNIPQLSSYDFLECEKLFLKSHLENLVKNLASTLNYSGNFDDSFEYCIKKLSTTPLKLLLENCEKFLKIINSDNNDMSCWAIANLHQYIALIKFKLNSELPLIDPPMKIKIKKRAFDYTKNDLTDYHESFLLLNKIYCCTNVLHPHQLIINELLEKISEKVDKLRHIKVIEPRPELFAALIRSIKDGQHAMENLPTMIETLNNFINNLFNNKSVVETFDQFEYYNQTIIRIENIALVWSKFLDDYPEILEPLLSNITEFLYGFKLNLMLSHKLVSEQNYGTFGLKLQCDVGNLVRIPSLNVQCSNYENLILGYQSQSLKNFIHHILHGNTDPHIKEIETLRLLKCGIQETYNSCLITTKFTYNLNKNLFIHFERLLKIFVDSWNKQEKDRELKEKEADDLYKTKTKCDDKSEEEQINDELKELFPNYHDVDFSDMHQNESNKTRNDEDEKDEKEEKEVVGEFSSIITENDLKFIVEIHLNLMQNLIKTEWLNPMKNRGLHPDFIHPLIDKFYLFKLICSKTIHYLNYKLDRELLGSLTILLSFIRNYGNFNQENSPSKLLVKKQDFYHDSNVSEVKSSSHVIVQLRRKIKELLEEWPDHPTLNTIKTVIERISNFEITSPLSRFLTGFEILLSKCNEWEQVAHSGVSLAEHSQNLTHQIIAWRKIELNMWKELLNTTYERMNTPTYKWWLYLYNVMTHFINNYEDTTEYDLIDTLQKFVTKSNLAEFEKRLKMIYVFHCHSTYLEQTVAVQSFSHILWNIYTYFQQFSNTVTNKIKELRAPIEKKLKDYVKIVRWKDINYWAIKETVDKSHKILHKYMREFQEVLQQPVSTYLVNYSDNIKSDDSIGIWDRPQRQKVKIYHYTLDPSVYQAKEILKKKLVPTGKLVKIESYFNKSRKLCKEAISNMKYPELIQNLDGFVTKIIETSQHLQQLEVDTTLSTEKQKKLAKSILQQKHRALADLFKNLRKIGLSFRTGLYQNKSKVMSNDYLIKPLDLDASFSHINYRKQDIKILTIWEGCELYYLKSLMRSDVLATALKTPAPDLGLQNIERCQGFTTNLINYAQSQKTQLIESTRHFYYLKHYLTQLTTYCDSTQFLSHDQINNLCEIMKNILITVEQTRMILRACPEDDFLCNEETEIILLKPEDTNFIKLKNDTKWNWIDNILIEIENSATKIYDFLEKSKDEIPSVEFEIIKYNFIPISDYNIIERELNNISGNIAKVFEEFPKISFLESFKWLKDSIESAEQNIQLYKKSSKTIDVNKLQNIVEKICEKILIIIQNIYKKSCIKSPEKKSEELVDEHLKKKIIENLHNDLKYLDMNTILSLVHDLCTIVFQSAPTDQDQIISNCLPLLEQLLLLYQYFLTQQVSAYRIICKMSSILLNIFIELASKGFCVPPELTEEDKEGISRPSDGLGLGEGQGERDVSDKIESEDQLDDAQPAGQEKQDQDDDCKENEKGIEMSEDFDSKLQDVEQKENDEEDDNKSTNSDAEEQMGETGPGEDQLNEELWGSDQEDQEGEEGDGQEESGEKGEDIGDEQLGAKEKEKSGESNKKDKDATEEKEENQKEINEMNEPEYDDEQTDPYHGNQPEMPEPEAMDLPDDFQLDDGEENDQGQQGEENPFDIDTMKEDNPFEDKSKEDENTNQEEEDKNEYSSDDEEITKNDDNNQSKEDEEKPENVEKKKDTNEIDENDEEPETQEETSGIDQTQSKEDNIEATESEQNNDKTQAVNSNESNQNNQSNEDEINQEDKPDKDGVGQSQMEESSSGHSAQNSQQIQKTSKRQHDEEDLKKQQKPGESDSQRTLGDINEQVKKKLKTIDEKDENEEGAESLDEKEENTTAETYKHIKDAKDTNTEQILDVATKEQAENQNLKENPEKEDTEQQAENVESDTDKEEEEIKEINPEKIETKKMKDKAKKHHHDHPEGEILDEMEKMEVDGDIIDTYDVARNAETTHHTLYSNLNVSSASRLTVLEINELRGEVEQQLSAWNEVPTDVEAEKTWQKISAITSSLAQDLSEQLRLVLEPTQASRLKGDFRTGRRINMRKVIPYIASQFRKDKIWLRRTKPSKRDYQIVLAIDDSSSMSDNHSKELAFESVALISKALTLLESGQLSVIGFGEKTEILHKLTDQFSEKSGVKLLQKFRFDQNKTCVGRLVDFVSEMFAQTYSTCSALNAKLLVIVGDGRGIFSEGETYVREAVRRAKLAGIFMVFVIVDNPTNKHSIFDIRMPVFRDGKLLNIQNYMDNFPFSFYIVLRDINGLPGVLSDALRQWFEVVSNLDKQ